VLNTHIPSPIRRNPRCRRFAILLVLIISSIAASPQNTLDKTGLTAATPAAAAYGTRLLSSAYAGKALQVRRSSDNSTQDIGFTAGGELDTAALKTFTGAGNGYLTAWYDQSGHALNLTQATAASQPQIVAAGVIRRVSTRPFIGFYGIAGGSYNALTLPSAMTTVGHVSSIMQFAPGGYGFILSHSSAYYWHSNPGTNLFYSLASASVRGGLAWSNGVATTPTSISWPVSLTLEELEPATPSIGTDWDNIGSDRGCCHEITGGGGYSELLVFPAALSTANRLTLENNQLTYFGLAILPVTWLSFTARADNGKAYLQWQTATEQDSKEFTVEYSTDAQSWAPLAILPAAGNSNTPRTYNYVHYTPQPGDNYYRIRNTSPDGNADYSTVVVLHFSQPAQPQKEFQVLQNPVQGPSLPLRVTIPTTIAMHSPDGKLLWRNRYEPGTYAIPIDAYPKGLYFLAGSTTTLQILLQ